jgi:hypothetical protein
LRVGRLKVTGWNVKTSQRKPHSVRLPAAGQLCNCTVKRAIAHSPGPWSSPGREAPIGRSWGADPADRAETGRPISARAFQPSAIGSSVGIRRCYFARGVGSWRLIADRCTPISKARTAGRNAQCAYRTAHCSRRAASLPALHHLGGVSDPLQHLAPTDDLHALDQRRADPLSGDRHAQDAK